jgi:hypothetical protein
MCIPDYADPLIQINQLVLQILNIKLLPNEQLKENSLETSHVLNLDKFMDIIYAMNLESEKLLTRFFIYVKYVLNETRESYYKKFQYFVKLMNQEDML